MRFVVALIACAATWLGSVVGVLTLMLFTALVGDTSPAPAIALLVLPCIAGGSAWVASRRALPFVEQHADDRFGPEPVVTAAAVALLLVFYLAPSGASDALMMALLVGVPFVAALVGTFIPWRPRRPIFAGALVAAATLLLLSLHV